MNVLINQTPVELPEGASVADAVAHLAPQPPFAVAVNLQFIPNSRYAAQPLADGDQVEIIAPVTGG
ncbi:sulfur carrier protein ThiS [Pulveribacter suum]|uniref:Thiamine biosynthesis protein ThiS n=1 Tax=Pulveribacter suum TaxID=2116657 RepID=A0A2P1NMM8_9BURK|nr:sulfur carrier protein ThiS [Pulveribacter suum]AVP58295.1 thiamine biosynthesis protein ThiS [Pulveribacter suum]